jgi:MFS family permease
LEGPSWVSTSPATLELNPGQTKNLNVKLNPTDDVEPGTYGVKINLEGEGARYSKDVDVKLRKEPKFEKSFKSILKENKYSFSLLILILVLLIVFRKQGINIKNKVTDRYKKYEIKQERIRNLKLARERRKQEKEIKKTQKPKKKISWKKYKRWIYSFITLIIVLIFLEVYFKPFNLKYIHIYAWNLIYGNLYYILIGLGLVFVLFLLYRYIVKRKKGTKKKKNWGKVLLSIGFSLILIGLVSALTYFNLFDELKDFFVLYSNYFVLGVVILIVIIVSLRYSKKLQKFFKE